MGSAAGFATKPSELLMRLMVASLTEDGAEQLDDFGKQQVNPDGPGQSPSMKIYVS